MKKVFSAVFAASLLIASAGAASAQSLTGSGTATGTLDLRQTLPVPLACPLNNIPVSTAGGGGFSTTGATTASPQVLCSFGPGVNVFMTSDWVLTPTSYTTVTISNITANALAGTCGAGSVEAEVLDPGPDLVLYIPFQVIPGSPVDCEIEGVVTISGVALI
jgi:hypothetical protein